MQIKTIASPLWKSNLVVVQFESSHSTTNSFAIPNSTNNRKTSHRQQHLDKNPTKNQTFPSHTR